MEIWLKKTESDAVRLPILPSSITLTDSNTNESITVHNVGEITVLGKPNLMITELQTFWPRQEYSFCQYKGFITPDEFKNKIKEWKNSNVVPRLIMTDLNINILVSIESFQFGEEDASGDMQYTISLKEYKQVAYTSAPAPKGKKTIRYTIKKGDTLKKIAKKKCGKSSYATTIYNQNKSVIEKAAKKHKKKSSKKGKYLYKGTKLVIKI